MQINNVEVLFKNYTNEDLCNYSQKIFDFIYGFRTGIRKIQEDIPDIEKIKWSINTCEILKEKNRKFFEDAWHMNYDVVETSLTEVQQAYRNYISDLISQTNKITDESVKQKLIKYFNSFDIDQIVIATGKTEKKEINNTASLDERVNLVGESNSNDTDKLGKSDEKNNVDGIEEGEVWQADNMGKQVGGEVGKVVDEEQEIIAQVNEISGNKDGIIAKILTGLIAERLKDEDYKKIANYETQLADLGLSDEKREEIENKIKEIKASWQLHIENQNMDAEDYLKSIEIGNELPDFKVTNDYNILNKQGENTDKIFVGEDENSLNISHDKDIPVNFSSIDVSISKLCEQMKEQAPFTFNFNTSTPAFRMGVYTSLSNNLKSYIENGMSAICIKGIKIEVSELQNKTPDEINTYVEAKEAEYIASNQSVTEEDKNVNNEKTQEENDKRDTVTQQKGAENDKGISDTSLDGDALLDENRNDDDGVAVEPLTEELSNNQQKDSEEQGKTKNEESEKLYQDQILKEEQTVSVKTEVTSDLGVEGNDLTSENLSLSNSGAFDDGMKKVKDLINGNSEKFSEAQLINLGIATCKF